MLVFWGGCFIQTIGVFLFLSHFFCGLFLFVLFGWLAVFIVMPKCLICVLEVKILTNTFLRKLLASLVCGRVSPETTIEFGTINEHESFVDVYHHFHFRGNFRFPGPFPEVPYMTNVTTFPHRGNYSKQKHRPFHQHPNL